MPAPKALFSRKVSVDEAKKAHNCQHVRSHRLQRGDRRLKVPKGRSFEHYCVECGLKIIHSEIERLQSLAVQLRLEST